MIDRLKPVLHNEGPLVLVLPKRAFEAVKKARAQGKDPYPGVVIHRSTGLPFDEKPRVHPFRAFIKGRDA